MNDESTVLLSGNDEVMFGNVVVEDSNVEPP